MTKLGFNLLAHPKLIKQGKYDLSALEKQLFKVAEVCDTYHTKGHKTSDLWFRIRGGNGSQRFGLEIFSDKILDMWSKLQQTYRFNVIYGVNFNDVMDYMVYEKIASKIKVHAIEMGNENYLPKFRKTAVEDKTGVVTKRTEKMSVEKYLQLMQGYLVEYHKTVLPIFVQIAPEGKNDGEYYKNWNKTILKFIKTNTVFNLNACMHCYDSTFPYELISKIKVNIGNKSLFVTEYGAEKNNGKHAQKIRERLGENDAMFSHELFNDYEGGEAVAWFNEQGLTDKGKELIKTLF